VVGLEPNKTSDDADGVGMMVCRSWGFGLGHSRIGDGRGGYVSTKGPQGALVRLAGLVRAIGHTSGSFLVGAGKRRGAVLRPATVWKP
jgi:hypothetical protein